MSSILDVKGNQLFCMDNPLFPGNEFQCVRFRNGIFDLSWNGYNNRLLYALTSSSVKKLKIALLFQYSCFSVTLSLFTVTLVCK